MTLETTISTCRNNVTCDPSACGWHLKPRSTAAKHLGTHTAMGRFGDFHGHWGYPKNAGWFICLFRLKSHQPKWIKMDDDNWGYPGHDETVQPPFFKKSFGLENFFAPSLHANNIPTSNCSAQRPYFSRAALWLDLFVSWTWLVIRMKIHGSC